MRGGTEPPNEDERTEVGVDEGRDHKDRGPAAPGAGEVLLDRAAGLIDALPCFSLRAKKYGVATALSTTPPQGTGPILKIELSSR